MAVKRGLSSFFEPNFKRPVNERKRISIIGKIAKKPIHGEKKMVR